MYGLSTMPSAVTEDYFADEEQRWGIVKGFITKPTFSCRWFHLLAAHCSTSFKCSLKLARKKCATYIAVVAHPSVGPVSRKMVASYRRVASGAMQRQLCASTVISDA
jgi:hypothetical protein